MSKCWQFFSVDSPSSYICYITSHALCVPNRLRRVYYTKVLRWVLFTLTCAECSQWVYWIHQHTQPTTIINRNVYTIHSFFLFRTHTYKKRVHPPLSFLSSISERDFLFSCQCSDASFYTQQTTQFLCGTLLAQSWVSLIWNQWPH